MLRAIKIPGIHYEYRDFSNFLAQNETLAISFDTDFDANAGAKSVLFVISVEDAHFIHALLFVVR